ncbi:TMEM45A [Bugula neritina]|uniref:TMEM45A n=1 Tax=Bugula neritina TaxID=10212 RepID=A0A7J7JT11_BUGNE|nr:TMEM45A [Bugula neritina]
MGTWLGHAAPGTFFICFSLWWLVRSMHSYYSQSSGRKYVNSLVKHCCCKTGCFGRLPLDNWVLIFVAALGVIMEVATSVATKNFVVMGNRQHLTMYISFGLVGLVSILVHHKFQFVPKGSEYMFLLAALIIELVLFRFHLHGREDVDTHMHMLLVYTIAGCMVAVSAEWLYPHSINALLARSYGFLLQGTWFHQIGVSLYTPYALTEEQLKNPESIMLMTLIFAWHMIGCLMVMLILNGLVYWCCSPRCQGDYGNDDSIQLLPASEQKSRVDDSQTSAIMNGYTSVGSADEDELYAAPSHKNGAP